MNKFQDFLFSSYGKHNIIVGNTSHNKEYCLFNLKLGFIEFRVVCPRLAFSFCSPGGSAIVNPPR